MECVWRCQEFDQLLRIEQKAIDYMLGYRQTAHRTTEAGGQLFGTVSPDAVRVMAATGPYPQDERRRYQYRSDPAAAKSAIDEQARAGRLYLGEWHTHAEEDPQPSRADVEAMQTLRMKSQLNASSVLLVIVGFCNRFDALSVCSFGNGTQEDWLPDPEAQIEIRRACRTGTRSSTAIDKQTVRRHEHQTCLPHESGPNFRVKPTD